MGKEIDAIATASSGLSGSGPSSGELRLWVKTFLLAVSDIRSGSEGKAGESLKKRTSPSLMSAYECKLTVGR